jgi:UDP-N-acetyl-D-mannosaminuronate dehydrogenase
MDSSVDAVIVGMGYVGLPLAREASAAGLTDIGFDVNPEVVDGLNHGRSHVDDLADSNVVEMLGRGFLATTHADVLRRARTIVVCVPTPLSSDRLPDLGPLRAAAVSIAEHLQQGTLVILESTTLPGHD